MDKGKRKVFLTQGKFVETCLDEIPAKTLFTNKLKTDWFA
jgi:hypothetical protein